MDTLKQEIATAEFRKLECNPIAFTLEEIVWEMVAEDFLTPENIGGWIESASTEREPSSYWGPISNDELLRIIFGNKATSEQRDQAVIVIRRRFFAEHDKTISRLLADVERTRE